MSETIKNKLQLLVSIYDRKAETYFAPAMVRTFAEAERNFKDLCDDKTNAIGKHPDDYNLVCVGRFDSDNGLIIPENSLVASGAAFEGVYGGHDHE